MPKLNQILAIEKSIKSRVYGEITKLHHALQKSTLLSGFSKIYNKKDEDSDDFPPEKQKVQLIAREILQNLENLLGELLDVTLTKDHANCRSFADIKIDGKVLIEKAPVTYLLFLEKQVNDLQTFVAKIPVLDPEEEWSYDETTNLYKTAPSTTTKTKKVQKPIVLYAATKEHPAQTQLITEDVIVGHWTTVKHSGALPEPEKKKILERIQKLANAIKFAREEANSIEAESMKIGKTILGYILDK